MCSILASVLVVPSPKSHEKVWVSTSPESITEALNITDAFLSPVGLECSISVCEISIVCVITSIPLLPPWSSGICTFDEDVNDAESIGGRFKTLTRCSRESTPPSSSITLTINLYSPLSW